MAYVSVSLEKEGFEPKSFTKEITTSETQTISLSPVALETLLTLEQMAMPLTLPLILKPFWDKLIQALKVRDREGVIWALRGMTDPADPPGSPLAAVFGIAGVVGLVTELLGSYPFAKFLNEEALQTIDMAISTALSKRQYDLAKLAIEKKKSLLDVIEKPGFLAKIPLLNTQQALRLFFRASRGKLAIDEKYVERELEPYMTPEPGDIVGAAESIKHGQDPSPYLPPVPPPVEVTEFMKEHEKKIDDYYWKTRNAIDVKDFQRAREYVTALSDAIDDYERYIDSLVNILKRAKLYDIKKDYINRRRMDVIDLQRRITGIADVTIDVGVLKIDCNVIGADVYIDGRRVGITPYTETKPLGTYTVVVKKFGYTEDSATLKVEKNMTTEWTATIEEVTPEPVTPPKETTHAVLIKTAPVDGAKIYVDGTYTFMNTPARIFVTRKPHWLRIEKAGYRIIEYQLTTADIDKGEVTFTLETEVTPPLKPNAWAYSITSIPSGARIVIDGVFTGKYTTDTIYLKPNSKYTLQLEKPGYKPWSQEIMTPPLPSD